MFIYKYACVFKDIFLINFGCYLICQKIEKSILQHVGFFRRALSDGNKKKVTVNKNENARKRERERERERGKKSTTPGIPRRSPIQVLTKLYVA